MLRACDILPPVAVNIRDAEEAMVAAARRDDTRFAHKGDSYMHY